jgi:hypothetical protein
MRQLTYVSPVAILFLFASDVDIAYCQDPIVQIKKLGGDIDRFGSFQQVFSARATSIPPVELWR